MDSPIDTLHREIAALEHQAELARQLAEQAGASGPDRLYDAESLTASATALRSIMSRLQDLLPQ
jgi:hypothetical protein